MVDPTTCSPDTLRLWSFLPEFAQTNDATGGYLFLSWLEGAVAGGSLYNTSASGLQDIDNLCRDTPAHLGWSSIMDVARCPVYALPWLAQFIGVRFTGSTVGDPAAMRLAILEQSNFNRGTLATIAAAAAPYLNANGYVKVIERYPDAYSLTVQVHGAKGVLTYAGLALTAPLYSNLPGLYPTYADMGDSSSNATITAAIQATIPGGLNLYVNFF